VGLIGRNAQLILYITR